MPIGADPHDFSPSSEQVTETVTTDLVVANGLGLEAGPADAIASAEADGATVLGVAPTVDPLEFGAAEAGAQVEVVELFVGSLGPEGSGGETYAQMVLTNAERIASALT